MDDKKSNGWLETLKYIVIALVIVVPVRLFIAEPFIVSGPSMEPTFKSGEYIIVDQLSYKLGLPARGDVVVFKPPINLKTYYIKRIIGLPGETVSIDSGKVQITQPGGKTFTLEEPYLVDTDTRSMPAITLTSDQYFVLGDNRPVSSDSRIWGPLPKEDIVGTPYISLYPLDTISIRPGSYRFTE